MDGASDGSGAPSGGGPTGDASVGAGPQFGLLGPFEARRDGLVLDLGGPLQRAVVAHLVLAAGHVVGVDTLVARLWGEAPPASALGTLQSYVSRLRRALEPQRAAGAPAAMLVSEAPGYALRVPRSSVDLFRFDDLVEEARRAAERGHHEAAVARFDAALALWRGPALGGLGGEATLDGVAARLEEGRATVVEDRFDALLALGRHASVIGPLEEEVGRHPLRERLWGQLALALYRARRQADALRALARARALLAEELGLDPGPELQRLEAEILRHDPSLVATPPSAPREDGMPEAGAPSSAEVGLVGRDGERHALRTALGNADRGVATVVLIEGEAGIGKTALLDDVAREAAGRGWAVAWGRCVEESLAPALWPWIEGLRALAPDPTDRGAGESAAARRHAVTGDAAVEALIADTSTETGVASVAPVELAAGIAAVLGRAAAESPVLLVLDDLHWADRSTLDLLPLVLARLGPARVVVVGAYRPLDLGASGPLSDALSDLGRWPGVVRLALEGLSPGDVSAAIAAVSGAPPSAALAQRVHDRTGGNPLFVGELTRLLSSSRVEERDESVVPSAVRDVVRRRLSRLPPETMGALAGGAVLGPEVDLHLLASTVDVTPDECLDALDPAVVTRILVPGDGGRFRFSHALVRDAVLVDLSPLRRARLHRRAADAIEAAFGADRDHAEPIATHRWEASSVEEPVRVVEALVRAGAIVGRRGALDRADELFERALGVARRLPEGDDRLARELDIVEYLLTIETTRSLMGDRIDQLAGMLDDVAARNDSDVARQLAIFTRWSIVNWGHVREAAPFAEAAAELAARSRQPYVVILAAYVQGVQHWLSGAVPSACGHLAAARATWAAAAADGSPEGTLPPLNVPGVSAVAFELSGDRAESDRCLAELEAHMRTRDALAAATVEAGFFTGLIGALRVDPELVLRQTDRALDPDRAAVVADFTPASRVLRAWALAMLSSDESDPDESAAAIAEIAEASTQVGLPTFRALQAEVHLVRGEPEAAMRSLELAESDAERFGELWWLPEIWRLRALAVLAVQPSAGDQAAALLDGAIVLAERQGEPILRQRAAEQRAGLRSPA